MHRCFVLTFSATVKNPTPLRSGRILSLPASSIGPESGARPWSCSPLRDKDIERDQEWFHRAAAAKNGGLGKDLKKGGGVAGAKIEYDPKRVGRAFLEMEQEGVGRRISLADKVKDYKVRRILV